MADMTTKQSPFTNLTIMYSRSVLKYNY